MLFKVAKCGKGALSHPDAVKMIPGVLTDLGINILLVSAFPGQTKLLREVCNARSQNAFFHEFLPFHVALAESLKIGKSFALYLDSKVEEFRNLFAKLLLAGDVIEEGIAKASILALGEDFSQMIIGIYLRRKMRDTTKVIVRDSRDILISSPDRFVGAEINQVQTRQRARENFLSIPIQNHLWVIQGSVCSSFWAGSARTAILSSGDGDVSAAVIAAALDDGKPPKGRDGLRSQLIYLKRFPRDQDGGNVLIGFVGITKILKHMTETGQRIISRSVVDVQGLPSVFGIVEFGNADVGMVVSAEPVILERLHQQRNVIRTLETSLLVLD